LIDRRDIHRPLGLAHSSIERARNIGNPRQVIEAPALKAVPRGIADDLI